MSRWDADQPGTGTAWWAARADVVPSCARGAFQNFLTALAAHNAGGGSIHQLNAAVSELIEALPIKAAAAPVRARLAQVLGNGRLRAALGAPSYAPTMECQNLILGLTNLLGQVGGQAVPMRYRSF